MPSVPIEPERVGARPGAGNDQVHGALGELRADPGVGPQDEFDAFLGGETSDMEKEEGILASVRSAQRFGALLRMEERGVDTAPPHLDISDAELRKIGGRGRRGGVGTLGALVEAGEVSSHRRAQPADTIGLGVAGKVGVVGGHDRDAALAGDRLTEPADGELGRAVHEVGAVPRDEARDGGAVGEGEADVWIERERSAGEEEEIVGAGARRVGGEGVANSSRVAWGDNRHRPAACGEPNDGERRHDRHAVDLGRVRIGADQQARSVGAGARVGADGHREVGEVRARTVHQEANVGSRPSGSALPTQAAIY